MIFTQIILILSVLFMSFYLINTRKSAQTKAYKRLMLLLFLALALVTIMFPDALTGLAHFLGVGRGADLLLYGVSLTMLFQLVNNYIKDREMLVEKHKLARKIALIEAKERYKIDI